MFNDTVISLQIIIKSLQVGFMQYWNGKAC